MMHNLALAAAESARVHHHAAAGHADLSFSSGQYYANSRAAFKAAIRCAYPQLDCDAMYGLWVDSIESVEYCANILQSLTPDEVRKFASIGKG